MKNKYIIIQDIFDIDNPSGEYLIIDKIENKIIKSFDFKKEAIAFIKNIRLTEEG